MYCQYLDALGREIPKMPQEREREIHFIYLKHEIFNLVNRRSYLRVFWRNLRGGDRNRWGVLSLRDPVPFLYDSLRTVSPLLKRLGRRVSGLFRNHRRDKTCQFAA